MMQTPDTRNTPGVSVLMVAFNGGRYLRPAVRSVLAQTFPDLELVLLDNGSGDGAVEAVAAEERDPRLRIVRERSNRGIPAGINRALAESRGRLVAVMDQDDLAEPSKIAHQVDWLAAHPGSAGVAARTRLIDGDDRVIGGDFTLHEAREHLAFTAYSQAANFGSHLWRRTMLERFPRREVFPFSSDFDFVARVSEAAPVGAIPEQLFRYRVHVGQTTQTRRHAQVAAEGAIRILTAQRRSGRPEMVDRAASWIRSWTAHPEVAGIHGAVAETCLGLGLTELAAYHARRLVGADRSGGGLVRGLRLAQRAMRLEPSRAMRACRLFLRGPLRVHGLRPWP